MLQLFTGLNQRYLRHAFSQQGLYDFSLEKSGAAGEKAVAFWESELILGWEGFCILLKNFIVKLKLT